MHLSQLINNDTQVYATKVSRVGGLLVRAAELGHEVERYRNHIIQSRTYA